MSSHPCFRRRWLLQVCLGKAFPQKHAFVDISVFLSLRKQQPRFAQGQPKKEFHRTSKVLLKWMLIERWIRLDKAQYAEFNVPTCVKIAVWQCRGKTGFLEQSWWPEFDMFGSMPWSLADANELLYSLQSKFDRSVYILVFAEGDCCRFAKGKLSPCLCGHQCYCVVVHQDSPKASPRAIFKWQNLIEPLKLLS